MARPSVSVSNKLFRRLLATALAIAFGLVLTEGALRGYVYFKYTMSESGGRRPIELDTAGLGWRTARDYRFVGRKVDAAGHPYDVEIATDSFGFRSHEEGENLERVLFVGDSYTEAFEVSNAKTYHHLLGRARNWNVFAVAGRGYGSLQELMLLEQHLARVQPEIVVLQMAANDLHDNYFALDLGSHNMGLRRPYLEPDGEVAYRVARPFPGVRGWATEHSFLLYTAFVLADRLQARKPSQTELAVRQHGAELPEFQAAAEMTGVLLARMRDLAPSARWLAFSADVIAGPYHFALRKAALDSGMAFTDQPARAVLEAHLRGEVVFAGDGAHWNEHGHAVVAEALEKVLSEDR